MSYGSQARTTLFGLFVNGLEKHLLETADIDTPVLYGISAPLLLYADDLILMSTSPEGLQRQLDALASFSSQSTGGGYPSKTKVLIFEASSLTARRLSSVAQLWSAVMCTDTLALCFMPPGTWHMASGT